MTETVEDITIAYSENGVDTIRELGKEILTKGAWTTILFRYEEWVPAENTFGPVKYSIRRYQKRNGQYWMKSKFNISNKDQAIKMINILTEWVNIA